MKLILTFVLAVAFSATGYSQVQSTNAPAKAEPAAKKALVKPVPAVKLAGWTNVVTFSGWSAAPRTKSGKVVQVPYTVDHGKVKMIFQKEKGKGEKTPAKGYYWRRPKAPWYVASNHEQEIRSFSQAKLDQESRE